MIYQQIVEKQKAGQKQLAVLIDPDKSERSHLERLVQRAEQIPLDYFFVGGSLLSSGQLDETIAIIRSLSDIPVLLFPGSPLQVTDKADALLFLSLISGRNAETLIGQQVIAAPYVKQSGLEVISTGYMLVDSGKPTTASYMSNSTPIPSDKPDIAACTALAGEYLGLKLNYLDGGSGALMPVPADMIRAVKAATSTPLIVGGGLNHSNKVKNALSAGADLIVVGNALEKDISFSEELKDIFQSYIPS